LSVCETHRLSQIDGEQIDGEQIDGEEKAAPGKNDEAIVAPYHHSIIVTDGFRKRSTHPTSWSGRIGPAALACRFHQMRKNAYQTEATMRTARQTLTTDSESTDEPGSA
jgi:hypothetical protein